MLLFLFLFLFGILIAYIGYKSSNDLISPSNIFVLIWFIPLSLSFLKLSSLQKEGYQERGLFIIFIVTTVMGVILLLATISCNKYGRVGYSVSRMLKSLNSIDWDRFLIVSLLSFYMLIVLVILYLVEYRSVGIPLLGVNQEIIRKFGGGIHRIGKDSKFQILIATDYMIGAISLIGFVFSKRFRWIYLFWALVPFVTGLLKLSKSDIVEPLITYSFIMYYIARGKGRSNRWISKRLVLLVIFMIFIFGMLGDLRLQRTSTSDIQYGDLIEFKIQTGNKIIDEGLAFYYGYSSLNFVNFSRSLEITPKNKIGLSLFRPFYTLTLNSDAIDSVAGDIQKNYLTSAATVGTFMRDLYFEWGTLMVFLGAIFYSGIIATIYFIFRRKPNIYTLLLYAGISFPFFWLFFQNAFSNLNIYTSPLVGIIMIFFFSKLSRKKQMTLPNQQQNLRKITE